MPLILIFTFYCCCHLFENKLTIIRVNVFCCWIEIREFERYGYIIFRYVLRRHILIAHFNNCIFLNLSAWSLYHCPSIYNENWGDKQNDNQRNNSTNTCCEFIFSLVSQLNRLSVNIKRFKSLFELLFQSWLLLLLNSN